MLNDIRILLDIQDENIIIDKNSTRTHYSERKGKNSALQLTLTIANVKERNLNSLCLAAEPKKLNTPTTIQLQNDNPSYP